MNTYIMHVFLQYPTPIQIACTHFVSFSNVLFFTRLTPFLMLHPGHIDHKPKLFVTLCNFVAWKGVPNSIGGVL